MLQGRNSNIKGACPVSRHAPISMTLLVGHAAVSPWSLCYMCMPPLAIHVLHNFRCETFDAKGVHP
jgi:hypothetical protein